MARPARKASEVEGQAQGKPVKPTLGFGVPATSDPHHFKVIIPPANSGKVQISEYLGLQASSDEFAVIDRVVLDRPRWTEIRSEVQRAFNARLKGCQSARKPDPLSAFKFDPPFGVEIRA